jgi:hypothetical protein
VIVQRVHEVQQLRSCTGCQRKSPEPSLDRNSANIRQRMSVPLMSVPLRKNPRLEIALVDFRRVRRFRQQLVRGVVGHQFRDYARGSDFPVDLCAE